MKKYQAKKLIKKSRYLNYVSSLNEEIKHEVFNEVDELITNEKEYCDKGNYTHLANLFFAIAIYDVLTKHKGEEEAFKIVSTEMWKVLKPQSMQNLAKKKFFLPLMKKVVPFGFKHGSGYGWKYTWHKNEPKNIFTFECNKCIYADLFKKYGVCKLGPVFCYADIINYGSLPYTDFIRTQTLCNNGTCCDFKFVRYENNDFERSKSI